MKNTYDSNIDAMERQREKTDKSKTRSAKSKLKVGSVAKEFKEIPDIQTTLIVMKLVDKKIQCADELGLSYLSECANQKQKALHSLYHLSALLA